ncbi:hypothetical protein STCU_12093 [Strigomonas culicis]|uniref:Uncharacterized protein n=1 Tax=Strigomonas culicis TaxID=28005 RepID=S9UKZ1_9TRYP|nr:hypothetical protein STCU_12093 [Strigomonas culicis]|eukprot:EPY15351.1 hypothetical protein STCU_12093 [Strigomonas culicis]
MLQGLEHRGSRVLQVEVELEAGEQRLAAAAVAPALAEEAYHHFQAADRLLPMTLRSPAARGCTFAPAWACCAARRRPTAGSTRSPRRPRPSSTTRSISPRSSPRRTTLWSTCGSSAWSSPSTSTTTRRPAS